MNLILRRAVFLALIAGNVSACIIGCYHDEYANSNRPQQIVVERCPKLPAHTEICFGAEPSDYNIYLLPADGGWRLGDCPTLQDFKPEYDNGYRQVSGPYDAGRSCCFEIVRSLPCN